MGSPSIKTREEILSQLAQVTIDRLPDARAGSPGLAHCDRIPADHEGGDIDLIVGEKVVGLESTDGISNDLQFQFSFAEWSTNAPLEVGGVYPASSWRMRNEVFLAVRRDTVWTHTKFTPTDGYRLKDDPRVWAPLTTEDVEIDQNSRVGLLAPSKQRFAPVGPSEAHTEPLGPFDPSRHEILPRAWNHEHCGMCWAHIDEEHGAWGYLNSDSAWLCERCYENYIVNNSLDFLDYYTNPEVPIQREYHGRMICLLKGIMRVWKKRGGVDNASNRI